MSNEGSLYRMCGQIYTYDELRAVTQTEVQELPLETWRDGVFNFDDYLTESVHTGTIEVVETTRTIWKTT